jgi:UDP-N-acetylglucosamine--N-acetylmuramyl-(pentapeptide) pyrophosphoryl-undecaprenol N-acetylglucosamine transferase
MKNTIIICGSHFTPAISLIEVIRQKGNFKIIYIGRKNSFEADSAISLEYQYFSNEKIMFLPIITAKWQRKLSILSLLALFKIPLGFLQSLYILFTIRPKITVSFGGYVSLPVCLASFVLGVPVIIHEQTRVLGLANRIISRIAQKVCLSYEDTKFLPKDVKTIITGNPIRKLNKELKDKTINYEFSQSPLIFITGGNQGARPINKILINVIPKIISKFRIFHLCGSAEDSEDFKLLINLKSQLPEQLKGRLKIYKHLDPSDFLHVLQKADLVISRAGANTVNELKIFGIPSILIPLPQAADDEQYMNALMLKEINQSEIILQKNLTEKILVHTIDKMFKNIKNYRKKSNYKNLHKPAELIYEQIDAVISSQDFNSEV